MNTINTDRYDDRYLITLEDYIRHNPTSSKRMVVWCPSGYYDIEVTLDDGSRWLYEYATAGMRCITRDSSHKLYENEEEYKRFAGYMLGKKIREAGFTKTAFAKECGINYMTLRNYIGGKNLPTIWTLRQMAAVLGCSLSSLGDFE